MDGRWGLQHSARRFSVIAVDAYRPPYIPPHLTTQEFFRLVRDRLEPDGVLTINVARLPDDRRLIEGLAATLESVFPSVFVADVPYSMNSILFATMQPSSADNLIANWHRLAARPDTSTDLLTALQRTVENLQPTPFGGEIFTDDRAPIEQLTNAMVIRFVLSGQLDTLSP
jgi:spermidine synthase